MKLLYFLLLASGFLKHVSIMQNLQKPRQWTERYFYHLPFPVSACPVVLKYILIAVFQGGIWRDWQDPIKANLAPELLSIKKSSTLNFHKTKDQQNVSIKRKSKRKQLLHLSNICFFSLFACQTLYVYEGQTVNWLETYYYLKWYWHQKCKSTSEKKVARAWKFCSGLESRFWKPAAYIWVRRLGYRACVWTWTGP